MIGDFNKGFNATVTIVVTPTVEGVLSNTASVAGNQADPIPGNNAATATTTVNALADLVLTKTDSLDPIIAGNNLTYTIKVTNNGPGVATGVIVTDTLPTGVTLVKATTSQGSCNGKTTVTCNIDTLNSGANATVTLLVTPTEVGTLNNTASVSATNNDPNSANNIDTESTTVTPPLCKGLIATIVGTTDSETLDGTSGPDIIVGFGGNDVINGLGGNDIICAGRGNDTVRGGEGNDLLLGEEGRDNLAGGLGRDRLEGGEGNDKLNGGGALSDTCIGGPGTDTATACESISSIP